MEAKTIQKSIIIDEKYLRLSSDIIFEEDLIFIRTEQVNKLFEMINKGTKLRYPVKVRLYGEPVNYIWGWKGTGKTTMLKWFQKQVEGIDVKIIYMNCRFLSSPSKLIDEIQRRLAVEFPPVKIDSTNNRILIGEYIKQIKDKQVFLLLDEIDKPLRNSKTSQPDEFLHYLIRLVNENKLNLFKIVFSTNIVNIERFLSDEVLSFLGGNKIIFGVYTVPEMIQILEKRAKKALVPGSYELKDLAIISKLTTEVFDGDIRTALNFLYKLAKRSEDKLNILLLDDVIDEINFEILKKEVFAFPKGAQLLLKSLLTEIKRKGNPHAEFSTDEISSIYSSFCEREGYQASQKTMFYNYLNVLLNSMTLTKQGNFVKVSGDIEKLHECLKALV